MNDQKQSLCPEDQYDLIVVGAGSGGIGAALAAGRMGLRVALVERAEGLGGNSTRGGVNCWEMGAGGTGIPFEIYQRLKRLPQAVGIYRFGRHIWYDPAFPGGEAVLDPNLHYRDTLRRFLHEGEARFDVWHGVPFEPDAFDQVLREMMASYGDITLFEGSGVQSVEVERRQLKSVTLETDVTLLGTSFVDSTASLIVSEMAGCETTLGREQGSVYGEHGAPEVADGKMNAVTQIYRVNPHHGAPVVEPLPSDIPADCWWQEEFPYAVFNEYPVGGWNVNMLPTMEGREYVALSKDTARIECQRRVRAHWHHVQHILPEMQSYRIDWVAPALGVREGRRLVGRYVLTEYDLTATLREQTHEDIICIADHSRDVHGEAHSAAELTFPYGVPFRCLLPREIDNLMVACRGASFSAIGASSCRLSRTMIQLGQAAGTAAAVAKVRGCDVCDVPSDQLRAELRRQHVQLEWPASPELEIYLTEP